jgi:uncharacterized RDD family membrane protein YckC
MTYPPNDPYGAQAQAYGAPQPPYGAPAVAYASWIQRVGAFLIDWLCVVPFVILAVALAGTSDNGVSVIGLVIYLLGLVLHGYNRWFLAGKTGQSWGKKAVGLRLVSLETGQPVGAGLAFGRDICHFVDGVICYIGYLWPLWDDKKQTLADKIVKTVVVR